VKQDLQTLLQQLKQQQDPTDTILSLLKEILAGNASKSQVGAFLFALGQLSPTAQLLASVSTELSSHALPLPSCSLEIVDIVGTGGDGMNTFNVSTASGFIAAAAGCCVAKVIFIFLL
jgi:anthranilate phosphoribosyltransferase